LLSGKTGNPFHQSRPHLMTGVWGQDNRRLKLTQSSEGGNGCQRGEGIGDRAI